MSSESLRGWSTAKTIGVALAAGGFAGLFALKSRRQRELLERVRAMRAYGLTSLPSLRPGSADVLKQVQTKLGVPATGESDTATRAAVVAFQRAHGLHIDGTVGPEVLGALGVSPANEMEVPQVSTPMTVAAVAREFAKAQPGLSSNSLALILAQLAFETGGFKGGLHNYNYGNYTHITGDGQSYYVGDDTDGRGRPVKHKFVAFASPQDGARFWVIRMRVNRPQAWAKIVEGTDPQGYVHALKMSRYFEAPEADYARGVLGYYDKYRVLLQGVA